MTPMNLSNAQAGLFRALSTDEAAKFARQGSADYAAAMAAGKPFELNPIHHPRYRQGALLAALEHVGEELATVAETRTVEQDRMEGDAA